MKLTTLLAAQLVHGLSNQHRINPSVCRHPGEPAFPGVLRQPLI